MKIFNNLAISLIALFLISCGGEGVTPISEKIQGPLGEFFQVVNKEYKAKDNYISIELKRIKAGMPEPWVEGMDVGDSDGKMEPHFTAEFQDTDGSVVSKDKTDIVSDKDELNAIASLGVDETASITFFVSEDAKLVKIGSTFKVHGEADAIVNLAGSIGKYPIQMTMHIASDGEVTGAYYYKSKGPGNYLYVKGKKNDDQIILEEYTQEGEHTGEYIGNYTNSIYKGVFKAKSGGYQFNLSPDKEMEAIDLSRVRFSDFPYSAPSMDDFSSDNDFTSGAGSEDWDALLDAYDSYVTKYISCIKKVANGDMSAIAEYSSLMSKTRDLSEKIKNARGDMSPSQWSRYIKITTKMSQAAEEMQ